MKEIWRGGNNERLIFHNFEIDHATNKPVYADLNPLPYYTYWSSDPNIPSLPYQPSNTITTGKYAADIDPTVIEEEGLLTVEWQWGGSPATGFSRNKTDHYRVITPYLSLETLVSMFPEANFDEIRAAEKYARTIIDNYTGQNFGNCRKSISMFGRGTDYLLSPEHVLSVDSAWLIRSSEPETPATGAFVPPHENSVQEQIPGPLSVSTTGYAVKWGRRSRLQKIRQPGIFYDWEDDISYEDNNRPGAIIGSNAGIFVEGARYDVYGKFGYKEVPSDISAAAEMLAADFFCRDREWKENYIKRFESDAWSFEIDSRAFSGTGNMVVDNLLSDWIWHRMVVI